MSERSPAPQAAREIVTSLVVSPNAIGAPQPVAFGIPMKKGLLSHAPGAATLANDRGLAATVQLQTLERWSDDSVKWLGVDAILPAVEENARDWRLAVVPAMAHPAPLNGQSHSTADYAVACGPFKVHFESRPAAQRSPIDLEFTGANWSMADSRGMLHHPAFSAARLESNGPVRQTIVQEDFFPALKCVRLQVRWSIYADLGLVRCDVLLHNSRRARHAGGLWDLGDAGSVLIRDLSFRLELAALGVQELAADVEGNGSRVSAAQRFDLYQDSSGGDNWQSRAHVNRLGAVPLRFRGYQAQVDDTQFDGLRAEPVVTVRGSVGNVAVGMPEFWQQFPKALRATPNELRVGLFPGESTDLHELQGGEQKRHTFWLQFSSPNQGATDLRWAFTPAIVTPSAEACIAAAVTPELRPRASAAKNSLETVLEESLAGDRGILANRERVDEYGWRNFGDIFADHEEVYFPGPQPFVSHYNNQFDVVLGSLWQYLRTEDRRWFCLADQLARHVMDIDVYHTREDKPAYNGGLFWFTDHYLTAHESTHRTYSRKNAPPGCSYGGGPGAEHNYTSGLLLYYRLTGCPQARKTVLELADWVVAMEDGRSTLLGVVDDEATGAATAGYAKPSRGGANSINALVDAWSLTANSAYLTLAETLIQRCIHPSDDLDQMNLLDAEHNWSYTMFLSSLAKYAEVKEEANENDRHYQLATSSLLHYARWMLSHERPYLDHREDLEYPTEAWAAQELRKANVFRLAARYAPAPLADQLLAKGNEFGDRAWRDLMTFKDTRATIRAVALVMTEGLSDCVFRHSTPTSAPAHAVANEMPARQSFMPQKQRVLALMRSPTGLLRLASRVANPARWRRHWHARRRGGHLSRAPQ